MRLVQTGYKKMDVESMIADIQHLSRTVALAEAARHGFAQLRALTTFPEVLYGAQDRHFDTGYFRKHPGVPEGRCPDDGLSIDVWNREIVKLSQLRRSLIQGCADLSHDSVSEGRFLASFFRSSVSDGSSSYAGGGFVDTADLPPWDLWICAGSILRKLGSRCVPEDSVVSWIPAEYLPAAESAIQANPVDILQWVDRSVVDSIL